MGNLVVSHRQRGLIAILTTAVLMVPSACWAGGWYWVFPPPGAEPGYVTRDWAVIQVFERLATCQDVRADTYAKALEAVRRAGARLTNTQREMLRVVLDKDASPLSDAARIAFARELQKDPLLNDALAAAVTAHMTNNSVCVAANDPRVRNSPILSLPPLSAVPEEPVAKGGSSLRYTPGRPIIVTASLNGRFSARLILDTGADRTILNPRALIAAGVDLSRPVARGEIRGIAGKTEALYFTVDSLALGDASVQWLRVAAHDIGEKDADGLLGRDFLDRFRVSIDPALGTIKLMPK